MKEWLRNLITKCIAIAPSLIVSIIGGFSGAGRQIIIASVIVISWILGLGIIGINVYYHITGFVGWLIHSSLPKVANVFIGIIMFPVMAIYLGSVIYRTFRKDTVKTFIETKDNPTMQTHVEKGFMDAGGQLELSHAPYREDLANIPFPQ